MVDIQTVSIAIASAGVFVAAIYYILQLRNQTRMRQSDLLMRINLPPSQKEYIEAYRKVISLRYKDYDDFVKKYGDPNAEGPVQTELAIICMFFEGLGLLLKRKLADIGLLAELFPIISLWIGIKPLVEGMRKQSSNPHIWEWFEYLANEAIKHYQQRGSIPS